MITGGFIKYAAFKGLIGNPEEIISILKLEISTQVFWAGFGFALFGVGVEYAGITVSKSVAKWFKGNHAGIASCWYLLHAGTLSNFIPEFHYRPLSGSSHTQSIPKPGT